MGYHDNEHCGAPETGDKNFTSGAGAIGTELGKNKKLRVAQGSMKKTEDFKNQWKGEISYRYMDDEETGSFNYTFDQKKEGYYIFNIVRYRLLGSFRIHRPLTTCRTRRD
jgi:hypothetical protein